MCTMHVVFIYTHKSTGMAAHVYLSSIINLPSTPLPPAKKVVLSGFVTYQSLKTHALMVKNIIVM